MTMGQTAGTAAALAAKVGVAVQDVDRAALTGKTHDHCCHLGCILPSVPAMIVRTGILLAEGQILSAAQLPGGKPGHKVDPGGSKVGYVCAQDRCFQSVHAPVANSTCDKCAPLKPAEWLALKQHW